MKGKNKPVAWDDYPVNRQLKRHFVLGMIWYTVTFIPIMMLIASRLDNLILCWLLLIPLAGVSWAMWSWRQGERNVKMQQGATL